MSNYDFDQVKTEHFKISRNLPDTRQGQPEELERGVYVGFTCQKRLSNTYDAISTSEARAAGEALIALADEIEADQKPRYPEEPARNSFAVVVKFANFVPAYRTYRGGKWKFISTDREYTWEQLCDRFGVTDQDFEVLYHKGE